MTDQMAGNKILKYPKTKHLNIGVVIFLLVLFYVSAHLFMFLTENHIAVYEVEYGTIAENNTYKGLILRDETVVMSDFTGDVNYYLKDGNKASVKTLVCSVDETGEVAAEINRNSAAVTELDSGSMKEISAVVQDFSNTWDRNSFYHSYPFKENLESVVMEAMNLMALKNVSETSGTALGGASFHLMYGAGPGVAVYYTDGYEGINADNLTLDIMNEMDYTRTNLKSMNHVSAGTPIYKLITNEDWQIALKVDDSVFNKLRDRSTVRVRFLSDDQTVTTRFSIRDIEGSHVLFLNLNNSMIRYAGERFTELELLLDKTTGLKLPNSSIVNKSFFLVPKQFFTQGGDSNAMGLMKESTDSEGNVSVAFVRTSLYFETADSYYVSEDELEYGDIVEAPDSGVRYPLTVTVAMQGAYNVNKGYAVFKRIEPLYSNAEYTIVKIGTSYGLSLYDHVALNGYDVNENQLVN